MSPDNPVMIPLIYLPSHIFMFWNPKYIDNVLETETEKKIILIGNKKWPCKTV